MCCAQSCLTLFHPMDYNLPGASVHGILHTRILEWVVISYSKGSSWPRYQIHISCFSCIGRWILYHWALGKSLPMHEKKVKPLSHVQLFATPRTVAYQAPPSMGFSRQKYCSGLSFPTPRDLPDPGIKHTSLVSPALAGNFFTTELLGKPLMADDMCLLFVPIACW